MRRRLRARKYIILLLAAVVVCAAAVSYIASVTVPVLFHTTLLGEFERAMGKKMLIRSVTFDLFRGLVLEGVIIYDAKAVHSRTKRVTAYLLLPHLLNKQIVIPYIQVEHPRFVLERREDGSFSLGDLIPDDYVPVADLSIIVHRVIIRDARLWFVDRTLEPDLKRQVEDLNIDIRVHPSLRMTYDLSARVVADPSMSLSAAGDYAPLKRLLTARIALRDVTTSAVGPYLAAAPLRVVAGRADVRASLTTTPAGMRVNAVAETSDLAIAQDALRLDLDGSITVGARYDAASKELVYGGKGTLGSTELTGLAGMPPVRKMRGRFGFDMQRLWTEELTCEVAGIPWEARVNVVHFDAPLIDVYGTARTRLGALQKALCDECGVRFPLDVAGPATIEVAASFEKDAALKLNGYARLSEATMRLGSGQYPLERITGEIHFTPAGLDWKDLSLVYRDRSFRTAGEITDLAAPVMTVRAVSQHLSFEAAVRMRPPTIEVAELTGAYRNSTFDAAGELSLADPATLDARLAGSLDIDMADVRALAPRSPGIRKMRPAGKVAAEFTFAGPLHDLALPALHVKATSPLLYLYGVRFSQVAVDYVQETGVGAVRSFQANTYGGTVRAAGEIDWFSRGQPFIMKLEAEDVMLERVKRATPLEKTDLGGDLKVYAKLSGAFKDLARLKGLGRITITDGNLWELNFFKGLGTAIFTSDFKHIIFSEGACDFRVSDLAFYADGVELTGELVRLAGLGRIGFDRSVDLLLRPELMETAMPYVTDTQRGMAMAVQEGTVIQVTGTLKDPRFRTRTDVLTVMGGVAEAILGRSS